MKPFFIACLSVTALLIIGVSIFLILLAVGVVEVRWRQSDILPVPIRPSGRPPEVNGAQARLVVIRGLRPKSEYLLCNGRNILGRTEEQPVEIDLQAQEPDDRLMSSVQHACITCEGGDLTIEDLGSANCTFVNGTKVQQGKNHALKVGDAIQIGEVELKVLPVTPVSSPRLVVIRGLRLNREHFIVEGLNVIGRGDKKPVGIDIQDQEPEDRVWASSQHASITRQGAELIIEDLNTANGTYVNRHRVPPGTKNHLKDGDVIQIGEVQLKVVN